LLVENHSNVGKAGAGNPKKQNSERDNSTTRGQWEADPTQLLPTLQLTELMGIVSVLYGLLLHGAPERPTAMRSNSEEDHAPPTPGYSKQIPEQTLSVALAVMRVLNAVALMDLRLLQVSMCLSFPCMHLTVCNRNRSALCFKDDVTVLIRGASRSLL